MNRLSLKIIAKTLGSTPPAAGKIGTVIHRTKSTLRFLLFLALAMALPSGSYAQVLQMVAVGDGAQFDAWALAARGAGGVNNFTIEGFDPNNNPWASMVDTRAAGILPQEGAIWILWDNTPAPNTNIWAYLSVDSIVAVRGFDASPRALLVLDPAIVGPAGMNLVPGLPPDVPLPIAIFNALSAPPVTFNAAMTGVSAANAKNETTDLLTNPANPPLAYAYGPAPFNLTVLAPFNPLLQRQPVEFNTGGKDPITKLPVAKTLNHALKKSLLVPFVNATNLAPGHLGGIIGGGLHDAGTPCAPATGLAAALNGLADTTGLLTAPGAGFPLTVFLDNPLSGTWYFMEHNVMNTCPAPTDSQEFLVNPPAGPPNNPLTMLGPGGIRDRIIGRDMTLAQVAGTPDSLGYIIWTCPLAGVNTYLTVGTQNPWAGAWTGVFPGCGVKPNAKYPLQFMQNVITDNPVAPGVNALIPVVTAMVLNENWP